HGAEGLLLAHVVDLPCTPHPGTVPRGYRLSGELASVPYTSGTPSPSASSSSISARAAWALLRDARAATASTPAITDARSAPIFDAVSRAGSPSNASSS